MTKFIPVKYGNKDYPNNIKCNISEVAAHFDKETLKIVDDYSLHTEYSYGKRKMDSVIIDEFKEIKKANKKGVPQLWYSKKWAEEFAYYIKKMIENKDLPKIIEIHPPFNDYCPTIEEFFERYKVFEEIIHSFSPDTQICLENRAGTVYSGGSFLISDFNSVKATLEYIDKNQVSLKMVLDYPQLFTASKYDMSAFPFEKFKLMHQELTKYKKHIKGIHIWGKLKNPKGRWVAHSGDLNTLFDFDLKSKREFLKLISEFYNDEMQRYFVPEVNSSPEHLQSIVKDFLEYGAQFQSKK